MQARFIFLSASLLLCFHHSFTQYVEDGAIIHIEDNAIISTNIPFHLDGFMANEGRIILRSDWKNDGIYQGNGSIELNGTLERTFSHNGQDVAELIIENSARLNGKLPVINSLDLIRGIVYTTVNDTLLIENDAIINGGSPSSFVEGPLHRGGRGQKYFPVGNSNNFLPVTLGDVSGGNTIVVIEALADFSGTIPDNIDRISRQFYWRQSHYRDAYTGSEFILPMYDDQLERSSTVVLGLSSEYTIYDDLTFSNGTYYPEAGTQGKITEEFILLATAEENIRDESTLYIPNVLSTSAPDPENRVIKVYGDLQPEGFEFVVYDRRGIQVYRTTNLLEMQQEGWSGTSENTGEVLTQGSYVFAMKAVNQQNETVEKTGTVTILK
jgi:hypothetical protein